jgi:hypothetical protein
MSRATKIATNLQILKRLWNLERKNFGFSEDYEEAIGQIIDEVFNPLKTRGSLLRIQREMPSSKDFPAESIKDLESLEYVVTLPSIHEERITITPEGLAYLANSEMNISLGTLQNLISSLYRKHCFHQIRRLGKKETLKPKHVGVILFFLLNGSIGEEKAYIVENSGDKECVDRVVRAFLGGSEARVDQSYALEYYLVEAKRILGDVIHNVRPKYFLKWQDLDYIVESVAKTSIKDLDFSTHWNSLVHEYHRNLTYLRSRKNSYHTASWEMELANRFLGQHLSLKDYGEQ